MPVSIALLVIYVVVTWISLRRHRGLHVSDEASDGWPPGRCASRSSCSARPTIVTAFVAETLVHTLEVFAEELGLTEFFVAAVIVAIVGNAAEHGGAVVVAHRGNIKLAAEIALASSAQVAVFLIPAVALLSWLIEPLSLAFRPDRDHRRRRLGAFTAALLWGGYSTRWRGYALIAAYIGVAIAFFAVGDRARFRVAPRAGVRLTPPQGSRSPHCGRPSAAGTMVAPKRPGGP